MFAPNPTVTDIELMPVGSKEQQQAIFDAVARHLFAQGKQSSISFDATCSISACSYREGELRCSVGIFIHDDQYGPQIEGLPVKTLLNLTPTPIITKANVRLLSGLQSLHDRSSAWVSTKSMQIGLYIIAQCYDLSTDVVRRLSFEDR